MFSMLETSQEIAKAQQALEATIRLKLNKRVVKNIGYPGGTSYDAEVLSDGHYWFWSTDARGPNEPSPRRLNWFGLFREDGNLQISVEINIAYEGRNNRVAGFFAQDHSTGLIYLMHSGRVGGGTKGVGRSAFLAWSDQRLVKVHDSLGDAREGVLVMPVEGFAATRSIVRYIDTIARFKLAVRAGEIGKPDFRRKQKEFDDFYAESRGRRRGRHSETIDYLSRHGDIIDALHAWRKSVALPNSGRLIKSVLIDMGVAIGHTLVEVYEVKTSAARTDIYTAIGQLMVHGALPDCRRVMVLPDKEPIAADLNKAIEQLGIDLLRFRLDGEKAKIT